MHPELMGPTRRAELRSPLDAKFCEGCSAIHNVVRLAPRKADYQAALDAYLAGRSKASLALLYGDDSIDGSLLRVRALLRIGREGDAIGELSQNVPPFSEHAKSAVHQFLVGTAFARNRRYDEAFEALRNAESYARSTGDSELITETAFYRALTAFMRGDYVQAEDIASETLDDGCGTSHARLLDLLGLVAGLRGDVDRQIIMHVAANEHLSRVDRPDAYFDAGALNNLAVPAAEVNPPGMAEFIRQRARAIPWNDELRPLRFHVTHHLAWLEALAGNHVAAFREFRAAVALAPTPARGAEALVGRGYLAREMGETMWAAECVAHAEELVEQVDWNASDDDERHALLQLATLVAPVDPIRASRHVERYKALKRTMNPMHVVAHGGVLFRAKEAHAFGLVAHQQHGAAFAATLLRDAHRLFRSISSNWRAALVALDLHDLVGDRAMLAYAREHAARVPQSWLARRVARVPE